MFILNPSSCTPSSTLQSLLPTSISSTKYPINHLSTRLLHSSCVTSTLRAKKKLLAQMELKGFEDIGDDDNNDEEEIVDGDAFSWPGGGFGGSGGRDGEGKDYDRDPEFADILGSCLDDPDKARSKMEERLRKKRNKILHTKTGSAQPLKVTFNKYVR